jgi:hypothetical protein
LRCPIEAAKGLARALAANPDPHNWAGVSRGRAADELDLDEERAARGGPSLRV